MMGLEKMMASMIGKTPDEMRAVSEQVTTAILESAAMVAEIHGMVKDIQTRLEAIECQTKPKVAAQSKRTPAS